MKSKKAIALATVFLLSIGMSMGVVTDTDGLEHTNPEMNGSLTLSDAEDTALLTAEVSTDSVGGTTLQDGDTISDIQFKINDSSGDSLTVSSFNISEVDYYSDGVAVENSDTFTVGTDVPVDSTAEVVAEVNKSQLTGNNVTLNDGEETLTFESSYNVTGTVEYERTEFTVYESIGSVIMALVMLILPVFVILMVLREFEDFGN